MPGGSRLLSGECLRAPQGATPSLVPWSSPRHRTQCLPRTERSLEVAGSREPESDSVKVLGLVFQNSNRRTSGQWKRAPRVGFQQLGVRVGGGGGAWGWRFPELSFGRNLQSDCVLEGGKVFPAPTANQVWQGRCCAANLREERRNRPRMELVVLGFRFVCV